MVDLSKYILQALYETTGQTRVPIDVLATLTQRWSNVPPDDLRTHLAALSGQGLIALRADGAGLITEQGIRTLSQLWQAGAFTPQDAGPSTAREPDTEPGFDGNAAPGQARLGVLRSELEALTGELSGAVGLPMQEWSAALEVIASIDGHIEGLDRMLKAAPQ